MKRKHPEGAKKRIAQKVKQSGEGETKSINGRNKLLYYSTLRIAHRQLNLLSPRHFRLSQPRRKIHGYKRGKSWVSPLSRGGGAAVLLILTPLSEISFDFQLCHYYDNGCGSFQAFFLLLFFFFFFLSFCFGVNLHILISPFQPVKQD